MGRLIFFRTVGVLVAAGCLIYVGDALVARYRIAYQKDRELSLATFYYSAALKNSKIAIFGGEPVKVICIHSLFPHFGYPTCRAVANKTIELY